MNDQSFTHLGKPNTGDYYDGSKAFMRAISPRPCVASAEIPGKTHQEYVFREDSYDPTTRVRRGRFYEKIMSFAVPWDRVRFEPYPRPTAISLNGAGAAYFQFAAEQTADLAETLRKLRGYDVIIGRGPARTSWQIIDAEALSDGGVLYTLRSRSSFGTLPMLDLSEEGVEEAYQNVIEAALRFDTIAQIDACRNSASAILGRRFNSEEKDLGHLAGKIEREHRHLALSSAARLLAKLHSRTKPSERATQAKDGRPLREISDDDGLLAIRLFGFILEDLTHMSRPSSI